MLAAAGEGWLSPPRRAMPLVFRSAALSGALGNALPNQFQRYAELYLRAADGAMVPSFGSGARLLHVALWLLPPALPSGVGAAWAAAEPARLQLPGTFTPGDVRALACIHGSGTFMACEVYRPALHLEVEDVRDAVPSNGQMHKLLMSDWEVLQAAADALTAQQQHLRAAEGLVMEPVGSANRPLDLWVAVQPHGPSGLLRAAAGYPPIAQPTAATNANAAAQPPVAAAAAAAAAPPAAASPARRPASAQPQTGSKQAAIAAVAAEPAEAHKPSSHKKARKEGVDVAAAGAAPAPAAAPVPRVAADPTSGAAAAAVKGGTPGKGAKSPAAAVAATQASKRANEVKIEGQKKQRNEKQADEEREEQEEGGEGPSPAAKRRKQPVEAAAAAAAAAAAPASPKPGKRVSPLEQIIGPAVPAAAGNAAPRPSGGASERKSSRGRKRWSDEETQALLDGLLALPEEERETAWTCIKRTNGDVLASRSNVDLKDKWRNLQHQASRDELTLALRAKVMRVLNKMQHTGTWHMGMQW